ncbi:type II toxin-antitoxin system VapC family toxin [Aquisalimonas sp.]|uniref:type II toxin-antitoxin system VapC family toxin n=1 Tax=Aquisalimonas sp. TaxID=1872621 RepID=UPI0025C431BD|nr:type II toxin-antitoxin system VapC family toxin [Aquisalimonas sp.]
MIFLDTNVVSETLKPSPDPLVIDWLIAHDAELALPAVALAELAYGIERVRPHNRAKRLARGLVAWRDRLKGRIFSFGEAAAMHYGELMGEAARNGLPMSIPDGMIAATARVHAASLATRNVADFRDTELDLINPWIAPGVQER